MGFAAGLVKRGALRALSVSLLLAGAAAQASVAPPSAKAAASIAVKVMVVANFEPGKDTGDAPGEFQLWAEREHLTQGVAVRGVLHPLMHNDAGLYGIVWGDAGSLMAGAGNQLTALLLDPRYDFSHTYWLFTGISGTDPQVASVGSVAWSRWVVSGDTLREFDDREVPAGWPYGLFAIGAKAPGELPSDGNSFGGTNDVAPLAMAVKLNQGLVQWAYDRTKSVVIPDSPALAKARAKWTGYPEAQKPPHVLLGETLGTVRYWHGPGRTQWARDWVKLWTGGQGRFAMTNMESQAMEGAMLIAAKQGLVDLNRVMVLRSASNPSMPPPGEAAADSVGDEGPGQTGRIRGELPRRGAGGA